MQCVPAEIAVYRCPMGGVIVDVIAPLPFDLSTAPSLRKKYDATAPALADVYRIPCKFECRH